MLLAKTVKGYELWDSDGPMKAWKLGLYCLADFERVLPQFKLEVGQVLPITSDERGLTINGPPKRILDPRFTQGVLKGPRLTQERR